MWPVGLPLSVFVTLTLAGPPLLVLRYPESWYRDITSNKKFFSLAATYRGAIVGMIVAEIKSRTKIHKEVGALLCLGVEGRVGRWQLKETLSSC